MCPIIPWFFDADNPKSFKNRKVFSVKICPAKKRKRAEQSPAPTGHKESGRKCRIALHSRASEGLLPERCLSGRKCRIALHGKESERFLRVRFP